MEDRRQEACLFKQPWVRCARVDHCLSLYCWRPSRRSIWLLQDHPSLHAPGCSPDITANGPCMVRSLPFEAVFSLESRWLAGLGQWFISVPSAKVKETNRHKMKLLMGSSGRLNAFFLFFPPPRPSQKSIQVPVAGMWMWVAPAWGLRSPGIHRGSLGRNPTHHEH